MLVAIAVIAAHEAIAGFYKSPMDYRLNSNSRVTQVSAIQPAIFRPI